MDDTPENLDVLRGVLTPQYRVSFALNGKKAIELACAEDKPDLILLDIMMPEMDGYEVCRRLKEDKTTDSIPIIFVTALEAVEDETSGLKLGAVDFIHKPITPAIVLARIKTQLNLSAQQRELEVLYGQQNQLLHVLCHDLTNPLGSIRGLCEIMIDSGGEDPDFITSMIPIIETAAGHGLEVIDLVRKMKSLEEFDLSMDDLNLEEAVNQSVTMLKTKIDAKQITIANQLTAGLKIKAEKSSLVNSVINNLLTNAIKFTEKGKTIFLTSSVKGEQVELEVRDQGIGMPEKMISQLFDVKKKTSRPGTDGESGTGFGMPLVEKFMHAYGGTIAIESCETGEAKGTAISLSFLKAND